MRILVNEYTYLGLTFHCGGNFKIATTMLYNKALRAYNCLMQKLSNAENIPIKTLVKLFYSVVVPVLLGQLKIIFSFSSDFLKNGGRAGGF